MGQQMKKGIPTHCPHSQCHKEGEEEFEASLVDDGNQNHAQQGKQANDGDRDDATDPRCGETVSISPTAQEKHYKEHQEISESRRHIILPRPHIRNFDITVLQNKTKT